MTAEEIVVQALARVREYSQKVPVTRSLAYVRIGQRQQELFAAAARVNPDFYGVCAHGEVDEDGALDLDDISDPVPSVESIQRIEIYEMDTPEDEDDVLPYAVGDVVNVVHFRDPDVESPPRVTVRDRVIRGVSDDLDRVVALRLYYSRVPASLGPTDAATDAELPPQFQQLLVIDLVRDLFRRSVGVPEKATVVGMMDAEEKPLLEAFLAHVVGYAPVHARFARDGG